MNVATLWLFFFCCICTDIKIFDNTGCASKMSRTGILPMYFQPHSFLTSLSLGEPNYKPVREGFSSTNLISPSLC